MHREHQILIAMTMLEGGIVVCDSDSMCLSCGFSVRRGRERERERERNDVVQGKN